MAKLFDDSWTRNQSAEGCLSGTTRVRRASGRRRALRRQFPMRQVLLFMLAVFSFKIFLFLDLGGATYGAKMVVLSEGTMLERVAARAMVMDPVSEWIIDGVRFGTW